MTRVRDLVDEYWNRFLSIEPLFATAIGNDRFDDRLPDPSEAGLAERERVNRDALKKAEQIDRSELGFEDRTALDAVRAMAEREVDFVRYRLDRLWAVSHMLGGHRFGPGHLLGELGQLQVTDTPERVDRYLIRLGAVPRYFDSIVEALRQAVAEGQVAPRIVVERSIAMVDRQVSDGPEQSPALGPLQRPEDRERAVGVLRDLVYPSLARYLDALREYGGHARESIGISALPNGVEIYAAEIKGWTSVALDPRELHDLGVAEQAKLDEEGRAIASRHGHADAAALVAELREESDLPSREQILEWTKDRVARSWDVSRRFFGRMPGRNCEVRPVEEFREKDILDYYQGASLDGSRPAIFHVNTAPRPLYSLAATIYHEANPGHHLQTGLEVEAAGDRHAIRRWGGELYGAAFAEGWGLYSERLADEMGLYEDDYERVGMLELQSLRATRLIVDTGIHVLGWGRPRVVEALEATGLRSWEAEVEADRYIAMPGQALCYKVGQMEIERSRDEAASREGSAFSLRHFHDRLLAMGSLPLPTMRRELEIGET
ncbi:MAG TPA: DUF885 domain-containing protein [Actinomycetota bacterium]|nr:DUF885 domain-containing protein [Actinomycetota bacterium]